MTKLSVNINKIATLRNSRGGNEPNVLEWALKCEEYGAEGITVHPRPDERHIKYSDVYELKNNISTEFNIEGYPGKNFINLVCEVIPAQVTLVPDAENVITSNAGWNTIKHCDFLTEIIKEFKNKGIRVSIFIDTDRKNIETAAKIGADRIELYTEPYAAKYSTDKANAVKPFIEAAIIAKNSGLGINAGHDLNLQNLKFLKENIPFIDEVSIGHALISDALIFGMENTIQLYLKQLK
jgi:pyridoxine 5-phosphate synthase